MNVTRWLLDSDPAIRWQVMRDVTHDADAAIASERARVATEGWGARLLDLQAPHGHWGPNAAEGWMPTMDALVLLKDFGLDPKSDRAREAVRRVREYVTWVQGDGSRFFDGETEPCINGRIVGLGAYFGVPTGPLVARLLDEQLEDGGWNCEAPPSTRSSFHTTICVLEGLHDYERVHGSTAALSIAQTRAREYLLERRLLYSLRSGEPIDRGWVKFSYPVTWHYDVLRGLDYLRGAGVAPDERVAEPIEIVKKRRHQNGLWPLNIAHEDRIGFAMEPGVAKASKWNTLRAVRVLRWYDGAAVGHESIAPQRARQRGVGSP